MQSHQDAWEAGARSRASGSHAGRASSGAASGTPAVRSGARAARAGLVPAAFPELARERPTGRAGSSLVTGHWGRCRGLGFGADWRACGSGAAVKTYQRGQLGRSPRERSGQFNGYCPPAPLFEGGRFL